MLYHSVTSEGHAPEDVVWQGGFWLRSLLPVIGLVIILLSTEVIAKWITEWVICTWLRSGMPTCQVLWTTVERKQKTGGMDKSKEPMWVAILICRSYVALFGFSWSQGCLLLAVPRALEFTLLPAESQPPWRHTFHTGALDPLLWSHNTYTSDLPYA